MKNLVSIIEIPVNNLGRSIDFYEALLEVSLEEVEMEGAAMGVFPVEEGGVSVVLIRSDGYTPGTAGALIYLNAGDDLQPILDKIEGLGGAVQVPKTLIDPEMGYFAVFTDSEGNKMGLHSAG